MGALRRPAAILVALVVSVPSFHALLGGHIDLPTAGQRFLIALGLAWVAAAGLDRLVTGYGAAHAAAPEVDSTDGSDAAATRARRHDDT